MQCLDDCHTYALNTFLGGSEGEELTVSPVPSLPILRFYEMREDGKKIDGVTNEELIRVLIHRLEKLNKKFFCPENSFAIDNLRGALMWLNKRTEDRIARKVEGMHKE